MQVVNLPIDPSVTFQTTRVGQQEGDGVKKIIAKSSHTFGDQAPAYQQSSSGSSSVRTYAAQTDNKSSLLSKKSSVFLQAKEVRLEPPVQQQPTVSKTLVASSTAMQAQTYSSQLSFASASSLSRPIGQKTSFTSTGSPIQSPQLSDEEDLTGSYGSQSSQSSNTSGDPCSGDMVGDDESDEKMLGEYPITLPSVKAQVLVEEPEEYATALDSWNLYTHGCDLFTNGDYKEAIEVLEEVLEDESVGTDDNTINILLKLGEACSNLGDTGKSIGYYTQLLGMVQSSDNTEITVTVLYNMASICYSDYERTSKRDSLASAINYYKEFLRMHNITFIYPHSTFKCFFPHLPMCMNAAYSVAELLLILDKDVYGKEAAFFSAICIRLLQASEGSKVTTNTVKVHLIHAEALIASKNIGAETCARKCHSYYKSLSGGARASLRDKVQQCLSKAVRLTRTFQHSMANKGHTVKLVKDGRSK